jgi:hypothetical protein
VRSLNHRLTKGLVLDRALSHRLTFPLSLPQLNRLVEASCVRDESSVSNDDVTVMPSQFKVTKQILLHWQPFRDLKLN